MRRKLFLLSLAVLFAAPVLADITVEESTDAEYLINAGYSQVTAEDVFMLKNRAMGKPVEPLYEKSQNKFVRVCKKFYAYLDPAQDTDERIHHDVKMSPAASDL